MEPSSHQRRVTCNLRVWTRTKDYRVIEQRNEWLLDISATVVEEFKENPEDEEINARLEYFLVALAVSNMEVEDARKDSDI